MREERKRYPFTEEVSISERKENISVLEKKEKYPLAGEE